VERRLAAILAADVVGYSKLMGEDETTTLADLRLLRGERFEPTMVNHGGSVMKRLGDGWLVEFPSVSKAVESAIVVQDSLKGHDRIRLRIGIHIGEITVQDDDFYGDGVNIAVRLQEMAQPGEILLSDTAHHSIDRKTAKDFQNAGTRQLKNIVRSVTLWCRSETDEVGQSRPAIMAAPRPIEERASIAVLPFENMSSDLEQEYFADGITEDIITELSKFRWLTVIARNSSFVYKGRAIDLREVGRALGVRYILEGSIRRAANKVRITGQLIDTKDGSHIWADKFDGELEDIFELQDNVTLDVISAIEPTLRQAEINRLRAKPTNDLQAYELYLRAQSHFHLLTDEDNREAINLLSQAVGLDPGYAIASALLSWCYVQRTVQNWDIVQDEIKRSVALANQVLESDRADAMALAYAAHATTMFSNDYLRAREAFERSLSENSNSALAHALYAANLIMLEDYEDGLFHAQRALQLSPKDTFRYNFHTVKALAQLFLARYDEAAEAALSAVIDRRNFLVSRYILIAALALKGDEDGARNAVKEMLAISPKVSIGGIMQAVPFFRTNTAEKCKQAWLVAGIPQ
jgi:TolB-like protein